MPATHVFRFFRVFVVGAAIAIAGCASTGNRFDTTDLRFLMPGETTLAEATALLQGEPVNVYRQLDGSSTVRWAHTATLATDAVYFNQELWLAFDSYGRFLRIVKSNNIPHANLYQDGRRVDVPRSQRVSQDGAAAAHMSASVSPAPRMPAENVLFQPAASYPLSR